ncbi:MAG TPA: acetoacetate--CoA ligase [Ilumatobacter sp.]|nr:acetoacetate--CoA ligase [Ilumatobacter sp.]
MNHSAGDSGEAGAGRGDVLWHPSAEAVAQSTVADYSLWLAERHALRFGGYRELQRWSTSNVGEFWESLWHWHSVLGTRGDGPAIDDRSMPGAQWFAGARLNFAEQILGRADVQPDAVVIRHCSEGDPGFTEFTWRQLRDDVSKVASCLRDWGVGPGDRVAGLLPNGPEAIVACLATVSIGAVWSGCAPEYGPAAVVDRFGQLGPRVLFAATSYRYGGATFDRTGNLDEVVASIATLERVVVVGSAREQAAEQPRRAAGSWSWHALLDRPATPLRYVHVPFDHPIWILFTSGTTGPPKGIVHGHGGAVLAAVQGLRLHLDLGSGDTLFWYTSTGWVVWNIVLSALMFCRQAVIYDGSPTWPDADQIWRLADDSDTTVLGVSGAYLTSTAARAETASGPTCRALRALCYTGSAIAPDHFDWVLDTFGPDVWFSSVSGGTEVGSTFFLAGCITLPLRRGEFQCCGLGVALAAYDDAGAAVTDEVGELVIAEPVPSMPLRFWNDPDGSRYLQAYFTDYAGVWRHGDLVSVFADGGAMLLGRSDATLNRNGIRVGTAEIYQVVEAMPGVSDALVVDLSTPGSPRVVLFVALEAETTLEPDLITELREQLRTRLSPRHVPDEIRAAPAIPRTLNGKRPEVPVRRVLSGESPEKVLNSAALMNPESIDWFAKVAKA